MKGMKRMIAGWLGLARRCRPAALTADELMELGSVDREGAVARAVPHLCEALILEAEHELATAKPYGEGYAFAAARVAGRISAALELSERWTAAIESAWKRRNEEEREEVKGRRV